MSNPTINPNELKSLAGFTLALQELCGEYGYQLIADYPPTDNALSIAVFEDGERVCFLTSDLGVLVV